MLNYFSYVVLWTYYMYICKCVRARLQHLRSITEHMSYLSNTRIQCSFGGLLTKLRKWREFCYLQLPHSHVLHSHMYMCAKEYAWLQALWLVRFGDVLNQWMPLKRVLILAPAWCSTHPPTSKQALPQTQKYYSKKCLYVDILPDAITRCFVLGNFLSRNF